MKTVTDIIERLEGSAFVSRETGFPITTIESWKAVNFIPAWRHGPLLALAKQMKKPLSLSDFPTKEARIARKPTLTTSQEAA